MKTFRGVGIRMEYVFIRKEKAMIKIANNLSIANPLLHVVLRKIFSNESQDSINLNVKRGNILFPTAMLSTNVKTSTAMPICNI